MTVTMKMEKNWIDTWRLEKGTWCFPIQGNRTTRSSIYSCFCRLCMTKPWTDGRTIQSCFRRSESGIYGCMSDGIISLLDPSTTIFAVSHITWTMSANLQGDWCRGRFWKWLILIGDLQKLKLLSCSWIYGHFSNVWLHRVVVGCCQPLRSKHSHATFFYWSFALECRQMWLEGSLFPQEKRKATTFYIWLAPSVGSAIVCTAARGILS